MAVRVLKPEELLCRAKAGKRSWLVFNNLTTEFQMGNALNPSVVVRGDKAADQISNLYLAAIMIISCAFCFTPIELFIVEIWPRHGSLSLLFFLGPLIVGCVAARLLPDSYFRINRFELNGHIYEYLGIRFFKRFVPNGIYINQLIRRYNPAYRVVCGHDSIIEFEAVNTRWAEKCHIACVVLALPAVVYALMLGWNKFAMVLLLPNIPLHVYPVMLQRYTRARIQRIVMRRARARGSVGY